MGPVYLPAALRGLGVLASRRRGCYRNGCSEGRRMKRIISLGLSMTIIALALAGCSNDNGYLYTPPAPTGTAVPPVVTNTVETLPTAAPATTTAAAPMTATTGTGGKPD